MNIMKNSHIYIIFVFFGILLSPNHQMQAQTLQDAYIAIGEQRYEAARQVLDKLTTDSTSTTTDKAELWFLRAKTYAYIAGDIRGTFTGQDTVALFKSYKAYQEVLNLSSQERLYADSAKIGLDSLHNVALNIAGNYYKQAYKMTREIGASSDLQTNGLYKVAFQAAELAKKLDFKDTLSHSIATYSAFLRQDYPNYIRAMKEMTEVLEDDKIKYERYENLIATCRDVINDSEETLRALDLALIDFPDDEKFLKARIALNEEMGQNNEKLLNDAKSRVKTNPGDPINYFNLAVVYQRLNRSYEALDNYIRCISLDPSNFTAIFNVAGIYYNQGVEKLKEIDELTFTKYQKEGEKLEKQADTFFKDSLSYFETLQKLDPDNLVILKSLKQIYTRLKMTVKSKQIKDTLNEMGVNN
jgi:tetratricopeptide (TPR) repeat protein